MWDKLKKSWKYIKLVDIFSIFIFIFALPFALIFRLVNKLKKRSLWLICESPNTARDNGYHLFKYIKEEYPDVYCFYAINKKSDDYSKIEKYGNIIQYYSFKHWIYYLAANINISSQKAGNPNAPFFYFLQIFGFWKNKRVFLQHGMIINDAKWLYYDKCKFSLFICTAQSEYEFVKNNFGYKEEALVLTGLARFDNLEKNKYNKKHILLMPTWREWLGTDTNIFGKKEDFEKTTYYNKFVSLINNEKLLNYLEEHDIILYFYLHINMQKYIKFFKSKSSNVKIILNENRDIQEVLIDSSLMITDYSSVCMDFSYMRKPVIYYQFDKEEYHKRQYEEGYFKYDKNGFGKVIYDEEDVVNKVIEYIENDYKVEKEYLDRIDNFFKYNDKENCKRNYEAIKKIDIL